MSSSSNDPSVNMSLFGLGPEIFNFIVKSFWKEEGKGRNRVVVMQEWSEDLANEIVSNVQATFSSKKVGRDCDKKKIWKVYKNQPGRYLTIDEITALEKKLAADAIRAENIQKGEKAKQETQERLDSLQKAKQKQNKAKQKVVEKAKQTLKEWQDCHQHVLVYVTLAEKNKAYGITERMMLCSNSLACYAYEKEHSDLQVTLLQAVNSMAEKNPTTKWAHDIFEWNNDGIRAYDEVIEGGNQETLEQLVERHLKTKKAKRPTIQRTEQGVNNVTVIDRVTAEKRKQLKRKCDRGIAALQGNSNKLVKSLTAFKGLNNKGGQGNGNSDKEKLLHDNRSRMSSSTDGDTVSMKMNEGATANEMATVITDDEFKEAQNKVIDYVTAKMSSTDKSPEPRVYINVFSGIPLKNTDFSPSLEYNDGSDVLHDLFSSVFNEVYEKVAGPSRTQGTSGKGISEAIHE